MRASSSPCVPSTPKCAAAGQPRTRPRTWSASSRRAPTRRAIDWSSYAPPVPVHPGVQVFEDIPIQDIARFIDWTFFFHAWQLKGRYPQILDDPEKGEEARKLLDDARAMLQQVIAEKWLRAAAVIGLFPANAVGDDVAVYAERGANRAGPELPLPAQAGPPARGQVQRVPGGLRRPGGHGPQRLSRRLRLHRRDRDRRARSRASRPTTTTTRP